MRIGCINRVVGRLLLVLGIVGVSALSGNLRAAESEAPPVSAWPKDHPGAVYPELKVYGANGSPIRVPQEDWARARHTVETDPVWAKWIKSRRSEVDEWSRKRQDHVEWVAGWFHNFVSPKNGSELKFTPDEPGPDTLGSASDPRVELTPKLHAAWVYFFRSKNAGEMLQAARLYRLTGDSHYAKWAADQIDFYTDNLSKWPEQTQDDYFPKPPKVRYTTSRIMYQPLDEAAFIINLVQTARLLGDYVPSARRQHWIDVLFEPEATLLVRSAINRINNRSCWEFSAVGEVALYAHDETLWRRALDGPFGIRDQIARGVTSDYLWYEQSLHYNAYTISGLSHVFEDALKAGRGAELMPELETAENLMLTPAEMRFPTGQLPNPADGGPAEKAPDARLWADLAPIFPTAIGAYELAHQMNWTRLLDPGAAASAEAARPAHAPALPAVISRSFPASSMAVIRQGGWQVYLHYGQLTSSHTQAEALNYEAFCGDVDITQDPGTVGYGSAMTATYYRAAICHNVPMVDGVGQVSWDPGRLDGFSATSVSASQPRYQPKARASRTLAIEGEALKDAVKVTSTDGKEHKLGFLLHLMGKVEGLPAEFVPVPDPEQTGPAAGCKYWKDATRATGHDQAQFDVRFGDKVMRVNFELPGDFVIWHASAPDLLPKRRDVFYLETKGTEAEMRTTIRSVQ